MKVVFVRSNDYDITPAIPRAMEASKGIFGEVCILCWNRLNRQVPQESHDDGIWVKRFMVKAPRPRSHLTVPYTLLYQAWVFWNLICIRPDVVHACGWDSGAPVGLACRILRRRFVYDIRDPFAMCYRCSWLLRGIIYAYDWCIMAMASAFVLPTDRYVPYLGRWGTSGREICVIPNACHDLLAELPRDPGTTSLKRAKPVRLAYLGYLTENRGSQWLLDLCRESDGGVELIVAGGCRSASLQTEFESNPNVRFLGQVPYFRSLSLMRDVDAVTILYDPGWPVNRVLDPTKFYEAMMVGTPVLVSEGVSIAGQVAENGLGFVVPHGSMEGLRNAVQCLSDRETMAAMRRRCRQYYLDNLQLSKALTGYRAFYLHLVQTRGHLGETAISEELERT